MKTTTTNALMQHAIAGQIAMTQATVKMVLQINATLDAQATKAMAAASGWTTMMTMEEMNAQLALN